jgi:transposase
MLDKELREAVWTLKKRGQGTRAIALALQVSRNAVKRCLKMGTAPNPRAHQNPLDEHRELVSTLFDKCQENMVRVQEELAAQKVDVTYSTLTRFCRKLGLGRPPPKPAGHYEFAPGQEMQHDTSPHDIVVGGVERRVQTASVVLCFSRMRYMQMYPTFNRFYCKLFLTEAMQFFGGACGQCMIDNTHVVVSQGTGKKMVPAPEMAAFAQRFGFEFAAHAVGDANRSAHVERGFYYAERNFIPGRTFADWKDLNEQARQWCNKVNDKRRDELKARPVDLFAHEKAHLKPLPLYVPPVYNLHERIVDVEGYVSLNGNRYSVPYVLIGRHVQVQESRDRVEILDGRATVAAHARTWDSNGARVFDASHRPVRGSTPPREHPDRLALKSHPQCVQDYVAAIEKRWPARSLLAARVLHRMLAEYPTDAVLGALEEALHYGMLEVDRLDRMILKRISKDFFPK